MPNDPKFVRLANRLGLQMVADVTGGSGWSIGGLDVQEFPEDEEQAAYVRVQLGRGVLEPATQAEYDEVHDEDDMAEVVSRYTDPGGKHPWQEAEIQAAAARKRRSITEGRGEDEDDELSEEDAEKERRREILEEQEDLGLNTDDPEEQVSRVRHGGVRAKNATKKKGAKRRPAASSSSESSE